MVAYVDVDRFDSDIEIGEEARVVEVCDGDHVQAARICQQEYIAGQSGLDRKVRGLCSARRETVSIQREAASLRERRGADAYCSQSEIRSPIVGGDECAVSIWSQQDVRLTAATINRGDNAAQLPARIVASERHQRRST